MPKRPGPVKLLSIDGGGIRGLSAIVLLEQMMETVHYGWYHDRNPPMEPWQMFDMIGGSGTGGLIAIMLGRLRMSVADCKKAYMEINEEAFTANNLVPKIPGTTAVGPQFKREPLEVTIKRIIGDDWQSLLLKEDYPQCNVFVVAHDETTGKEAILRSYGNSRSTADSIDMMHIWEACRATSANPRFFQPIDVNGTTYSDGGLLYCNPVQQVRREANDIFRGREQVIVSLGTGMLAALKPKLDPTIVTVANELAEIAAAAEKTADSFHRRDDEWGKYLRLNLPAIGDEDKAEAKSLEGISRLVERYLMFSRISRRAVRCTQWLANDGPISLDVGYEERRQRRERPRCE